MASSMPGLRKPKTRMELLVHFSALCVGVAALAALAVASSLAAWNMYGKLQEATSRSDSAASELAVLQGQKATLQAQTDSLQTPEGVEAALRERYGVARPGEGVIRIVEATSSAVEIGQSASGGFFGSIFHTLFPW